ncbi:hypothetical protein TNCV_1174961 [Trichonephila clavipes]|nr:hypothetical protein TNCV_1174961 [Trichonephila clavipes]
MVKFLSAAGPDGATQKRPHAARRLSITALDIVQSEDQMMDGNVTEGPSLIGKGLQVEKKVQTTMKGIVAVG